MVQHWHGTTLGRGTGLGCASAAPAGLLSPCAPGADDWQEKRVCLGPCFPCLESMVPPQSAAVGKHGLLIGLTRVGLCGRLLVVSLSPLDHVLPDVEPVGADVLARRTGHIGLDGG